jgi:acetyl-CoA acyltransferase
VETPFQVPAAFICEGIRTPIGRYGGALAQVRTDDLASIPLKALRDAFPNGDWESVDEVMLGCANQSGEDNRNVARMALLLSGIPHTVPGVTVNRLCGSGMEAVTLAARAIAAGEISLAIAGGVESMSRAPFVMGKAATTPFSRNPEILRHHAGLALSSIRGWCRKHVRERIRWPRRPRTSRRNYKIDRETQDCFALRSQQKAAAAQKAGILREEIAPVIIPGPKGAVKTVCEDEHIRPDTTLEALAKLPTPFRKGGTVTAGNASGINDGACALFVASEEAAAKFGLTPLARVVGAAAAGVEPRLHGRRADSRHPKLLARWKMSMDQIDFLELNEALPRRPGRDARVRIARRQRKGESQRRRHRAGPSAGNERRAADSDRDASACRTHQGALRACVHVHWRGARHGDAAGTSVTLLVAQT